MREAWWWRGLMVAVLVLALGTAFCLFDQGDDGAAGHARPGHCLGLVSASLGESLLAALPAVGWTVSALAKLAYTVALPVPLPPPRPAPLV